MPATSVVMPTTKLTLGAEIYRVAVCGKVRVSCAAKAKPGKTANTSRTNALFVKFFRIRITELG